MFLLPIMSVILHRHDSYSAPSRLIRCTITTYNLHHHNFYAAPSQLKKCYFFVFQQLRCIAIFLLENR